MGNGARTYFVKLLFFLDLYSLKEGPLTTSNQLLSPYTVALRLRQSNQHFYMHLMGPKM
jgi:hypothetical protein